MEIKDGGILIISGPRTGSSNLMKSISSAYKKKQWFEPNILKKRPKYDSSSDVVKFVPWWVKHKWVKHINDDDGLLSVLKDHTSLYKGLLDSSKKFNTVILLNRRNREEQVESLYVLKKYRNTHNEKWGTEKEIDKKSDSWKRLASWLNRLDIILNKLSEDLNIPVNYYEDVYKNKSLSNKNIKLDLEYFKPKYKLKQEIKPKRLV